MFGKAAVAMQCVTSRWSSAIFKNDYLNGRTKVARTLGEWFEMYLTTILNEGGSYLFEIV